MSQGAVNSKGATLADVARAAGVSLATASRAVNGRTHVSATARSKVLAAAEELNFTPNEIAKSMISGWTGTVGVLTSDLEGRFMIPILIGLEDAFGTENVSVFLCNARGDSIREQHLLKALLSRRVDGIVVIGRWTNSRPSIGQDLGVPVVYAYAPSDDERDVSIVSDDVQGARLQIQHLLDLGRSKIAYISGNPEYSAATVRAQAAVDVMAENGLDLVAPPFLSNWTEGWGRDAAGVLLDRGLPTDAIACASDRLARGVLDTLRDRGVRVPEDIAVVGYDNADLLSVESRPQLSTIDAQLEALGRVVAIRLHGKINGEGPSSGIESLAPRLVIRGSTIASQ